MDQSGFASKVPCWDCFSVLSVTLWSMIAQEKTTTESQRAQRKTCMPTFRAKPTKARNELNGLPDGKGLKIAFEAVDRHASGPS